MATQAEVAATAPPRLYWRSDNGSLRAHPLWVRLIVEFVGTFILVCVAAGAGVINGYMALHHLGASPISRDAAVVAPGALVMALIYALGPLSGLHINPVVTIAFTARASSTPPGRSPTLWSSCSARARPRCSCSSCSGTWASEATIRSGSRVASGGRS